MCKPTRNSTVHLRRNHTWKGVVVQHDGDATLVSWLTGLLAGEQKWTETKGLTTPAEIREVTALAYEVLGRRSPTGAEVDARHHVTAEDFCTVPGCEICPT